jgi:hypothetical protein
MGDISTGPRADRASAKAAVTKGISRSLFPLLFSAVPPGGEPTELDFHPDKMASNASTCCKLAGLLIQACWCRLKEQQSQAIPPAINDMLRQIWSGNHSYTGGSALSLLQQAGAASADSPFRRFVKDPRIFVEWRDLLFEAKKRRFKDYHYLFRDFDKFGKFVELIMALPLLREVEYDADKQQFRLPLGEIHTFPFLFKSSALEQPLFLFRFLRPDRNPIIVFEDPFSSYTEEVRLEDEPDQLSSYDLIRRVIGLEGVQVPRGDVFFFGAGYDNLRNLAGIIANKAVTPRDVLETTLDECGEKAEDKEKYVRMLGGNEEEAIVNCITLVFIEFGPAHLLKKLFSNNKKLFERYLAELSRLRESKLEPAESIKQYEAELQRKQACIDRYLGLDSDLRREMQKTFKVDTQCWGILSAIGVNSDWGGQYVESLPMRIKMLEKYQSEFFAKKLSLNDTVNKANKLTERTFRFLICFYAGLFGYYRSREKGNGDFEKHEACMINAAETKYGQICRMSAGELVGEFRSFCVEAQKSAVIDSLLGRRSICDLKVLKGSAIDKVLGTINQDKHDKLEKPPLTRQDVVEFLDQILKLFRYLRDGKDEEGPIYPHVVSFREARHKRGGFVIHNYTMVSHDTKGEEEEQINILTPREFSASEQYYCIPLEDRATSQNWLEPFLIGCTELDRIFLEGGSASAKKQ